MSEQFKPKEYLEPKFQEKELGKEEKIDDIYNLLEGNGKKEAKEKYGEGLTNLIQKRINIADNRVNNLSSQNLPLLKLNRIRLEDDLNGEILNQFEKILNIGASKLTHNQNDYDQFRRMLLGNFYAITSPKDMKTEKEEFLKYLKRTTLKTKIKMYGKFKERLDKIKSPL